MKKSHKIPDLSDDARNRRLAEHLRSLGYFAVEMYDPRDEKKVVGLLVGAATPPREWIQWVEGKLS